MTKSECKDLIRYYKEQKSIVADDLWCKALEFAVAGWEASERNDWQERLPPLTGTAPDDEPVEA